MDGVRAGDGGGGEDGGDVEVAVLARRRPDADRFVGEAHVHGIGVGGGVHRHRLDPHLAAGAVDAERDLAAVGNEDLVEHRCRAAYSITSSGSPYSTGWPSVTKICLTVPARGAASGFITFMASMVDRTWPSCTSSPARSEEHTSELQTLMRISYA